MRIGFVTPEYVLPDRWDGGLANYLRKVGVSLAARGHAPAVFVLSQRDAQWQDGQITIYEVKKVEIQGRAKFRGFHRVLAQYLNARRLATAVWRIHRAKPLDIVQASSYMAPGYKLLGNDRIPIVCRVSSYTPMLRSAFGTQRNSAAYLSDWLEIRQVLDADASFAPSRFVANTYERFEGFRPQVIRTPVVLPDVVLDPDFYQRHLAEKAYLLFFGTLSRIKGVDLLTQVIPEVLQKHIALSLVFIGRDDGLPGGQKMFDYLISRCHGFVDRLHYWPALPKAQLYPIIANAVGVLMPSRVDNYPNACLEAQSLGVPVVGTYQSSLEEMIVDGETGLLATNGDAPSLSRAIESLLDLTVTQRQQMRANILAANQTICAEDRIGQLVAFYQATVVDFQARS